MIPPAVNLSGGAVAVVNNNNNNNNNYYNHISSHAGGGSGSGCGIGVSGNGYVNNCAETQSALGYSSNLSVAWTTKEDDALKELHAKYHSLSFIDRYARIAKELNRSIRDVAMRCKWMSDKENGKQRKDDRTPRKSKEKKEKVTDSAPRSQVPNRTTCPPPPFGESFRPMDGNDGIPDEAIDGAMRLLTDQSAQAMNQVCENINKLKLQDNVNLLSQVQSNLISVLQDLSKCDMEVMENRNRLLPLPAKINDELIKKVYFQAQSFANQS